MGTPLHRVRDSWNEWSETWYLKYRTEEAIANIINEPASAFHPTVYSIIKHMLPNLQGKRICVPSSGDNHAVFAFHLMGANVTSCDISERQLENSVAIARKHGWDITFICDDTMHLSKVNDSEYDFVYTSNGVHVWINDLSSMYANMYRILKEGGAYLMFDIHPIRRPFATETGKVTVINPYHETGPFGEVPRYKWRTQDIMNAMLTAGLTVTRIEEMYAADGSFWVDESKEDIAAYSKQQLEDLCNWKLNPMAALPQWLSIGTYK